MGNVARLHSAVLTYARDFMINKGFTYCIPPYMIRSDVVTGVMSFEEMDAMMYKIEGEDLYLIGTSEHSMIGKFKDHIVKEEDLQFLSESALADACCPGNPRDTSVEEIKELYKSLLYNSLGHFLMISL